jgi:predicted CXXCH cytochrome family protein
MICYNKKHMISFIKYPVLFAAILVSSCSMQRLLATKQDYPSVAPYTNPHTVCRTCHTSDKSRAGEEFIKPGADPSSTCLDCHDYKENHHPVDFVPDGSLSIPFPLFEGKIGCLTCHEMHGGPEKEGTSKLLRGGPYPDRRTICFRCHSGERYAAIDPHKMLDEGKKVRTVNDKPVCLFCHSIMPDPAKDVTDVVKFRADVGFLCWRCHPPMPNQALNAHFLITPTAKTLAVMHQTEETNLVILPMVPRGRITCSTCHNPHQEGVIQREAAAKGADAQSRLRLPSMCIACHLK